MIRTIHSHFEFPTKLNNRRGDQAMSCKFPYQKFPNRKQFCHHEYPPLMPNPNEQFSLPRLILSQRRRHIPQINLPRHPTMQPTRP